MFGFFFLSKKIGDFMNWSFTFFFNSVLLGIGLAMDAFSVSLANGLNEPQMKQKKMIGIAGVFAFFQAFMPMIGWLLIRTLCNYFTQFQTLIPWIALILLGFIGGKMLLEGIKDQDSEEESCGVGFVALIIQGIATSIDALSVGCTISEYGFFMALVSALIIALVTFGICYAGLILGKKFGTKIAGKASILGGAILIFIGLEIFIKGIFF